MMGTIELRDLHVRCIVGIFPHERELEQDVYLDIKMDFDFASAAQSEDINQTIDYTAVASRVTSLILEKKFLLIETMAEKCAQLLLASHPQLDRVAIAVKKPAAVPQAKNTIASVERTR
jgi:dihydroneopterin aldolase